jgi:hypothetical protein
VLRKGTHKGNTSQQASRRLRDCPGYTASDSRVSPATIIYSTFAIGSGHG